MSNDEKGKLIGAIIVMMRMEAKRLSKPFDAGDMFFSLAFKSDKDLRKIAKMCGV